MIRFVVPGIPAAKGSMVGFVKRDDGPLTSRRPARIGMRNDNKRTSGWQAAVAWRARLAMGAQKKLEGAVVVYAAFYLPRPRTAPKDRFAPSVKPDGDKLLRTVLDALTKAHVYTDDGQVVLATSHKVYAGGPLDSLGAKGKPRVFVAVAPYHVGTPGLLEHFTEMYHPGNAERGLVG